MDETERDGSRPKRNSQERERERESDMSALRSGRIVVVGASVMDMIAYVPRLPQLGETLHGSNFALGFGGKGANQAVAAAKLGGDVAMLTKVGADSFGRDTRSNFENFGVDTRYVLEDTTGQPTGVAPISVNTNTGDNSIVVVMGANDSLTCNDVEAARPLMADASLVLCQLEIPADVSLRAMQVAREEGALCILNCGGDALRANDALLGAADIVCPNEPEAEALTGNSVSSDADAEAAARELASRCAAHTQVVLTLGGRGALWLRHGNADVVHVPATDDKPVDTVGAGDAFMGALAYFLGGGMHMDDAIRRANVVAGHSVTKPGTQTSYPLRDELSPELFACAE